MREFNIVTKVLQNLGVRKRSESKFEDIYWDLFEKSDLSILQDLNQDFHINLVDTEEKFLFKFEHIPLTGGANVNNTFKDNALGDILQIPGYEQVWANPRTARPFPRSSPNESFLRIICMEQKLFVIYTYRYLNKN